MKMIKQILMAWVGVLVLTPPLSALGTNSSNNFSLTLSQATQRAVQTNRDLRVLSENLMLAEQTADRAQDDRLRTSTLDMQAFVAATATHMSTQVDARQFQIDQTILRETLGFYVMDQFAAIHMAEADLALFDQELAVMEADLAILRALLAVGFASELDYELAVAQRDVVHHDRQNLSRALDQAHLALNRLIGAPADRRHNLVFDLPAQPFEALVVLNMQGLINHQRQTHSSVEQARRLADIEVFRMDHPPSGYRTIPDPHNQVFMTNPATGEPILNPQTGQPVVDPVNSGQITVRDHQAVTQPELHASVGTASRVVADARDVIERHIQDQYVDIRHMERTIESLGLQVAELQDSTHVLQTRIDVGEVLAVEMQRHNLAIAQRQQELDNAILAHHLAVLRFHNPHVSPFL